MEKYRERIPTAAYSQSARGGWASRSHSPHPLQQFILFTSPQWPKPPPGSTVILDLARDGGAVGGGWGAEIPRAAAMPIYVLLGELFSSDYYPQSVGIKLALSEKLDFVSKHSQSTNSWVGCDCYFLFLGPL